jgi:hypothetical protein
MRHRSGRALGGFGFLLARHIRHLHTRSEFGGGQRQKRVFVCQTQRAKPLRHVKPCGIA